MTIIRLSLSAALLLVAVAALALPASAQDRPFAPTEAELTAWLKSTAASLKTNAEPDKSLLDTQYLGLTRDGKPVGFEVFATTSALDRGRKVYSFDDRAVILTPEGDTVRVSSTGLADASFNGIRSTLHLVVTGKRPLDLTVTAVRTADIIEVKFSPLAKDPAAKAPQALRIDTTGQPVALSGELQRLTRLTKWKPGDILALWSLDAVNGNINPVVLRALAGKDATSPFRVESWATQDPAHPALALQSTSLFNPTGALVSILKPDGIIKTVLAKPDFDKNWEPKFPK